MQLSVLELALIGSALTAFGALIAGVLIKVLAGTRFVSQSECQARHASDCRMNNQLMIKIDAMNRESGVMFRMLRAMVVYMDIPPEQKERILNERADD